MIAAALDPELLAIGLLAGITPLGVLGVFAITSDGRRANGIAFIAGWATVMGVLAAVGGFIAHGRAPSGGLLSRIVNIGVVVLGLALIVGSVVLAKRSRQPKPADAADAGVLGRLNGLGAGASFIAGGAMAPYPIAVTAGVVLLQSNTATVGRAVDLIVFLTLATWPMLVIVGVLYRGNESQRERFDRGHAWIHSHRTRIASVLMMVVGLTISVPALLTALANV